MPKTSDIIAQFDNLPDAAVVSTTVAVVLSGLSVVRLSYCSQRKRRTSPQCQNSKLRTIAVAAVVMTFDYHNTDTDPAVVLSVADAIRSNYCLAPLTDGEREQRRLQNELHRWGRLQREEQRRAQRERQQQEQEAIARQEAAAERAEANRRLRLEQLERDKERQREQQLIGLQIRAHQQEGWINSVENRPHATSKAGDIRGDGRDCEPATAATRASRAGSGLRRTSRREHRAAT
jgi:hypothetical protein